MTTLGPKFWNKLSQVSSSLEMDPKDLLAVMYFESGLNPASNKGLGKATGLIQFMGSTLTGMGYKGTTDDFKELEAEDQLDYVEKYVRSQMSYKGSPFKSATQYYVANFWPAALKVPGIISEDPSTPIVERDPKTQKYPGVSIDYEKLAYKENIVLDVDKDGVISYGDLDKVMNGVKSSAGFRFALNQLESGQEYAVGTKPTKKPESGPAKVDETYLVQINTLLDKYLGQIAASYQQDIMSKRADFKKHLDANMLIINVKSSDLVDSLEFARILCLALDEEVQAEAWSATDGKGVDVSCVIYGPSDLCIQAVTQLSKSLSETFEDATRKIGGVKVTAKVTVNTRTNYPMVDLKTAQSAYRNFHYKFINRK